MPLDEQSRRLTQFVIGNQQYEFNRLFYGISIGPAAFSVFMSKIFRPLILKKNAITYLDDVFMQSQTKEEMFNVLEHYHKILQNENLKAAPDKSHFFLTRVKFLGHHIERKTITPLKSRIDAIQKLQPPTNKKKIQEFLGMLNFLSKYVYKMQLYLRPFYNILRQQKNFEWNTEHPAQFEEIKKLLTEQISNTIPDPNQPFYAMCDASNFGIGAALLQSHNGTNKMNLISANSRLFTQAELRLSTLMRECTAIIYTLTEYEFLILGSKHPTVLFTDHKPIIFLFTQKSNPNHRVYRFQLILMKFPNLHIVWTAGKNLALPDTKNKGYQEIMFFDWKIQLEKIQLTRDLSDNTMIYQGIRLPCKNDQGYCDPTTRTQATIVWFPEDTCTTFQVAKIHARMIKFHEKYFIQSIPYEQVHPSRRQSSNFRNIHNIENKLTRFQIYQETELACKYRNPLDKTHYSEILVEYEKGFDMTTGKVKIDPYATSHPINEGTSYISVDFQKSKNQPGGHLKPHDTRSTRLQELSLMNSTYFGNIHYDIHLDMKLDYTISRIFQEMSLSELETLHQLCELERTQILQSLALAVLKIPYAGYLLSGNRSNFLDYEGNIL